MKKENTCCFTGPRPKRLPCSGDPDAPEIKAIRSSLREAIIEAYRDGYRFFMSGMAEGFDLLAAEEVIALKKELGDISLIAVFPYDGAAVHHLKPIQEQIQAILSQCDFSVSLRNTYRRGCEFERNIYMVDSSFRVIAYYNGLSRGTAHCWNYALRNHTETVNLFEGDFYEKSE